MNLGIFCGEIILGRFFSSLQNFTDKLWEQMQGAFHSVIKVVPPYIRFLLFYIRVCI